MELKSKNLMNYLKKNKSFEKENIKLFLKELNDLEVKNPTIIAFGNDTYDIIKRAKNFYYIDHGYVATSDRAFSDKGTLIKNLNGYFSIVKNDEN